MSTALNMVPPVDYQKIFDERYITSAEVARYVGVTRPALFTAREKGYLPGVIILAEGKVHCWDRQYIMPHLDAWKASIARRNGATPA